MHGKVVAITACTSGTGLVLAGAAAQKGAKVILLNRKSERANKALHIVKQAATGPPPVAIECDLMSFRSVRAAGAQLADGFAAEGIDLFVNNAGIIKDKATEDVLDQQTSHFVLMYLCMPMLETAARKRGAARIVNHSSDIQVMCIGNKCRRSLEETFIVDQVAQDIL